jgi:hypothetical protein
VIEKFRADRRARHDLAGRAEDELDLLPGQPGVGDAEQAHAAAVDVDVLQDHPFGAAAQLPPAGSVPAAASCPWVWSRVASFGLIATIACA